MIYDNKGYDRKSLERRQKKDPAGHSSKI